MAKTSAAQLLPPEQELPNNVRLLMPPGGQPRNDDAGSFASDLLRNAGIALGRNSKVFKMIYSEKLTEMNKLQDKIDEYTIPEKRDSKVLKLMEKLQVIRQDLDIFEGIYRSTKNVVKDIEAHCQLEFAFDYDDEESDER